ncbi:MAG: DNA primase family protein [Tepidiformaceae bacterium]
MTALISSEATTELEAGRLLAGILDGRVKYVATSNSWYIFKGGRWEPSPQGAVEHLAKELASTLYEQASEASRNYDSDGAKRLAKLAERVATYPGLTGVIKFARTEPAIAATAGEFDAHTSLINARGITIDLSTGTTRSPDPADMLTQQMDVDFDATARAPLWEKFLNASFQGDADLIGYVQRLFGYALTGENLEQVLVIALGSGANGKTTMLNVLRRVMGTYAQVLPSSAVLVRRPDAATNDLVLFKGKRLAVLDELPTNAKLNDGVVKALSGSSALSARGLYQEYQTVMANALIIIATNLKPEFSVTDTALWRRIIILPFYAVVPPGDRVGDLEHQLFEEAAGIVNWGLQGHAQFLSQGLNPPAIVNAATAAYRDELDLVKRFVDDQCEAGPTFKQPAQLLADAFVQWCALSGETANRKDLKTRLEQLGYKRQRAGAGYFYGGLRLKLGSSGLRRGHLSTSRSPRGHAALGR